MKNKNTKTLKGEQMGENEGKLGRLKIKKKKSQVDVKKEKDGERIEDTKDITTVSNNKEIDTPQQQKEIKEQKKNVDDTNFKLQPNRQQKLSFKKSLKVKNEKFKNTNNKREDPVVGGGILTEIDILILKDGVKRLKEQCRSEGLNVKQINTAVTKWKRREKRRLERIHEKEKQRICFSCRQTGHSVSQCPQVSTDRQSNVGICFKCGSTEHKIYECKLKVKGFPYAKCFVCNKIGHLSRDCEENPNGAYPKGGSCKGCGKTDHLIKNCPETKTEGKYRLNVDEDAEVEDSPVGTLDVSSSSSSSSNLKNQLNRQTKVVKF